MMPGMMPAEMGGGYAGTGMISFRPRVEYLLVRFFDFTAEPGRKYRYRVQLLLEDPNHPQDYRLEPNERTLDDTTKERLKQIVAEEQKDKNRRLYVRRTDWSAPSEVVSVAPADRVLAGPVELPRSLEIPKTTFSVPMDEPKAKVMSIVWDATHAADVPGMQEVYRGSVLNFKSEAAVVHPISLVYKALPDFEFDTNRVVLDIRGGEPLPCTEHDDPLTAPGELILLDADGNLIVRNELDDENDFRRNSPPEVTAATAPSATGVMPGEAADVGGMPGDAGVMPGSESAAPGAGRRRGRGRAAGGGLP